MKAQERILLESGTNEVEVLEFELAGQGFGVNVLKVQAIEQFRTERVTGVQLAHPAVVGTYQYRDRVITLINLGKELRVHAADEDVLRDEAVAAVLAATPPVVDDGASRTTDADDAVHAANRIVLVLEFNEQTTGFLVDGVNRIHRVHWDSISPLSPFLAAVQSKFTGSLNIDGREILVVDMERILSDILPRACREHRTEAAASGDLEARRGAVPLFLAEDSVTIRSLLVSELGRAGYTDLHTHDNGQSCLDAIQAACARARAEGRDPGTVVGAVVSDIEMPQLDGMTLCKRVKNEPGLGAVPVILFSSLINEQIALKCEAVGADAYLSKPRFSELVAVIDTHVIPGKRVIPGTAGR